MQYIQNNFSGGMNAEFDPTKIGANEYPILVNGRTRYNVIQPVRSPLKITSGVPTTVNLTQGIYGVGTILLVFIDGLAYYHDFNNSAALEFTQITNFSMSDTADRLYAAVVPASSMNFTRKLVDSTRTSGAVNLSTIGTGSPQCAIVQDGTNQPWIIQSDGTARQAKGYNDWTTTNREYVPIGKQMVYSGGVLYLAGYDNQNATSRKLNQIFRSVSGRPLDFMVNIDTSGNKPATIESEGGAPCVSNKVDLDDITLLGVANGGDGAILVSTLKASWLIIPDETNTIFGEPTFINQYLFPYGATNQFSMADLLGDQAIIGQVGIRSFNAVKQLQNEGNNAPFSSKISRLFEEITQNATCAINFDDYALFSVNTIYGPAIAVYDTIRSVWTGLDIYHGVGAIKQFAQIKVAGSRRLFFITDSNEIYEAFAGEAYEVIKVYVGEWASEDPFTEQKLVNFSMSVSEVEEGGSLQVTTFVDRKEDLRIFEDVEATYTASEPISIPFAYQENDAVQTYGFNLQNSKSGQRLGFLVETQAKMKILSISAISDEVRRDVNIEQQGKMLLDYDTRVEGNRSLYKVAVLSNLGPASGDYDDTTLRDEILVATEELNPDLVICLGNFIMDDGVPLGDDLPAQVARWKNAGKFLMGLGNLELDTDTGAPSVLYWENPNNGRYYKVSRNGIDFFVLSCDFTTPAMSISHLSGVALGPPIGDNSENGEQAQWLKNQLAASTARIKLVFIHLPPHSSATTVSPGYVTLRWPFKDWGASAVISGEGRHYERLDINAFPFINAGACGLGMFGYTDSSFIADPVSGSKVRYNDQNGILLIEIDKFNFRTSFRTKLGDIIDAHTFNT